MASTVVEVLVTIEQNKRKLSFDQSSISIEKLIEAVEKKFSDIHEPRNISHLQLWDRDYEEYVDLDMSNISEVKNKSKLIAVLKKDAIRYKPMEVDASDSEGDHEPGSILADKKLTENVLRGIHKSDEDYAFLQECYESEQAAPSIKTSSDQPFNNFLAQHKLSSNDPRLNVLLMKYMDDKRPLLSIADKIKDCDNVATALNLSSAVISGIKANNLYSVANQRFHVLRRWWSAGLNDGTATFLVLIKVLWSKDETEAAAHACEIAKQ